MEHIIKNCKHTGFTVEQFITFTDINEIVVLSYALSDMKKKAEKENWKESEHLSKADTILNRLIEEMKIINAKEILV